MIVGEYKLRPRYGEVDKMGYVYHGNYVAYCHQARTELLRSFEINDKFLEDNGIMLPVIEMNMKYIKPSGYDEELTINTRIKKLPVSRFYFEFEIKNEAGENVCKANSTLVFVDSENRKPQRVPKLILEALEKNIEYKLN